MVIKVYYNKFIEFLKKHNIYDEIILEYWKNNRILYDYRDEDNRWITGCYYEYKKNRLNKITLGVPYINDKKTLLINIHEYIHLYLLYHKLGKKYKIGKDKEVLPFLYERIFIKEDNTKELRDYYKILNQTIISEQEEEYLIALSLSEKLLNEYSNDNIFNLDKKVKHLVKKNKYS